MFQALLDRTLESIGALTRHVEFCDALRSTINGRLVRCNRDGKPCFDVSVLYDRVPDSTEWKVIDHCSTVTRLYAIYERFIRELLAGYLTFIEGNIPYRDLDSKIRIAYRRQIGRILIDLDQDRYQSLRLESIVADLSNGINGSGPYRLLPEAMLAHDQNLRLNELITIFDRCGIDELASWIARHRTLRDFFRAESRQSDTAEAELKQLVDFRNEASHGGIEIDTVLGPKILVEYLEFMQALCRSLAERVQKAALITSEIAKKTEKLGIITEKYSDNRAVAIIRAATLRQNDSIYLVGETYCYRVVVVSLMDNDVVVETLTTLEDKEVGLQFNTEPAMRAHLYAI